jgi:hypothetical protein
VRRDRIRNLRQAVDSPPPSTEKKTHEEVPKKEDSTSTEPPTTLTSETNASLYQRVQEAELEKQKALKQVLELEETLKKQTQEQMNNTTDLSQMMELADTKGDQAALQWARQQLVGTTSTTTTTFGVPKVGNTHTRRKEGTGVRTLNLPHCFGRLCSNILSVSPHYSSISRSVSCLPC